MQQLLGLCCENMKLSSRSMEDAFGNRDSIIPRCDTANDLQIASLLKMTLKCPYELEIRFLGFLLWPAGVFQILILELWKLFL